MVVAMLALIVAVGGSAYAASKINGKTIKKGSEPGNRLKKNSVTGKQVNESTLGAVPNANKAKDANTVGGASLNTLTIARATTSACDPATATFVDCGTVSLNLPRSGRVLVLANAGYDGSNTNGYRGDCRLAVDGAVVGPTISNGQAVYVPATVGGPGFNANGQVGTGLNVVSDALPAGTHSFALQCNQAGGSIEFPETYVSAVMLGAG